MSFELDQVGLTHANGTVALSNISVRAAQGERIALIGSSGAGKTTLLRLLGASLRPTTGQIKLLGGEVWSLSAHNLRKLRSQIGTAHQAPPIPPRQRVVTAVLAGRLGQWSWWRSFASLIYPSDIPGCREALAKLNLGERIFERCDCLSGGQLQRVGLARVIYQKPELILADEPVSALDPSLSKQAIAVLTECAQQQGATMICSLHSVDRALSCFPRVIGVKAGQIVFDLPPAKITKEMLHDLYNEQTRERRYRPPVLQVGMRQNDFKTRVTSVSSAGDQCRTGCE
jgi:phosphonate transport system ATP-binding protein